MKARHGFIESASSPLAGLLPVDAGREASALRPDLALPF